MAGAGIYVAGSSAREQEHCKHKGRNARSFRDNNYGENIREPAGAEGRGGRVRRLAYCSCDSACPMRMVFMGVSFSPDECCGLIRMIALKGPRKFRAKTSLSLSLCSFIQSFSVCVRQYHIPDRMLRTVKNFTKLRGRIRV